MSQYSKQFVYGTPHICIFETVNKLTAKMRFIIVRQKECKIRSQC